MAEIIERVAELKNTTPMMKQYLEVKAEYEDYNNTSPKMASSGTAVSAARIQTHHNISLSFAKRFFILNVVIN